ncbi:hypothetical protein ACOMHN_004580 [Nucella lapillus]
MGFFHQLRLLLWKNLTLKKRSPFVLLFEVFIPLVLFVILLLIRKKLPASPVSTSRYHAKPLPSAGLVSLLQMFCEGGQRDHHGFMNFSNSRATQKFLNQLQVVAESHNFFNPGFTPQEMDQLPDLYRAVINDPAFLHDSFLNATDVSLDGILTNENATDDFMVHTLGIPDVEVQALLHSSLHLKEMYKFLFGGGGGEANMGRAGLSSISAEQFGGLLDVLKKSAVAEESSEALMELVMRGILENQALLGQGDLLTMLKVVLLTVENRHNAVIVRPADIARLLKVVLLSPQVLKVVACDRETFTHLIVPTPPYNITPQQMGDLQQRLCTLNSTQLAALSSNLSAEIANQKIVNILHLKSVNLSATADKVEKFLDKVERFIRFQHELEELGKFVEMLPFDEDMADLAPANQTDLDPAANGTAPVNPDTPATPSGKKGHWKPSLLKMWEFMQTAVCGKEPKDKRKVKVGQDSDSDGDDGDEDDDDAVDLEALRMSSRQKEMLGIMTHYLYSNPKILYAPNNTAADEVIRKANATFEFIDSIGNYAREWLNISQELHDFLRKPKTEHNLQDIREMQRDLQGHRGVIWPLFAIPKLSPFISEPVHNATQYLHMIDMIDRAAREWLRLMEGISLNVYQGFKSEADMVNFFLTKAYAQNSSVIAGVSFENMAQGQELPRHVRYKIRQNATFIYTTKNVRKQTWTPGPGSGTYRYYQFGFVWVQDMIDRAIVDIQAGRKVVEPGTYMQQFPYPCYVYDQFVFMIEHVMPLCLTISWVYSVAMLVQSIVYEKEHRLKEVMKMMGLSNAVHWCAWFLTTCLQMTATTAMLTAMLKVGKVLPHSDPSIIFIVLQVYAIAIICFSFLISVLYSKAKVAAACAGIIYFLSYVPYMYLAIKEDIANDKIPAVYKTAASLFSTVVFGLGVKFFAFYEEMGVQCSTATSTSPPYDGTDVSQSLFSTTAFGLGAKYFAFYEEMGVGVQYSNINISPVEGDQYNLFMVTLMMVLDCLIYAILVWYIEHVHPGTYGLPKPWYFPFTKSYWFGGSMKSVEECPNPLNLCRRGNSGYLSLIEEDQACAMAGNDPEHARKFEPEPLHLRLGVCIDNLSKVYKLGRKVAVKRLSLNLYEGQITSFLGHNGAGKTTTMSMLSGLIPPSAGYATVYGMDIRTDMDIIRQSLGMCPQHNVLFDKFTVEEHLWFYAQLKGMKNKDIQIETDRMIEDLGLPDKRHCRVDCLSGGMQRKLSVAIAFVGGSRTVILDEPTAGVDPYARRAIWDLLVKYKPGRTILLSTHHMDEADILGDRIAIISNGQLKCCGSSMFLKNNIGDGYHLTLVKAEPEDAPQEDDGNDDEDDVQLLDGNPSLPRLPVSPCCAEEVGTFIQKHVPSAYLVSDTPRQLHYILPFQEAKKGNFRKLFQGLDAALHDLRVNSYGVMDTNLEEIFLKITEAACQEEDSTDNDVTKPADALSLDSITAVNHPTSDPVSSAPPTSEGASSLSNLLDPFPGGADDEDVLGGGATGGMGAEPNVLLLEDFTETDSRGGHPPGKERDKAPRQAPPVSSLNFTHNAANSPRILLEGRGSHVLKPHLLLGNHFKAVIIKRFHYITRNWRSLFSQIILPAIFVAIAMTVALAAPSVDDLPPLDLTTLQYYNVTQPRGHFVPITSELMSSGSKVNPQDATASRLMETLRLASGVGSSCVLESGKAGPAPKQGLNYNPSCLWLRDRLDPSHILPHLPPCNASQGDPFPDPGYSPEHFYPWCTCAQDKSGYQCHPSDYQSAPSWRVITQDWLVNTTGQYTEDYLLYTTYDYRLHRYGALSFGLVQKDVPEKFGLNAPPLFKGLAVRNVAKLWFNNKGYHSLPTFLNAINNAILRANLPATKDGQPVDPATYGITVINHPWNGTNNVLNTMDFVLEGSDVLISIFIIVAMSFVPASFVVFLVYERCTKAKHLQFVTGINPVMYWIGNYVWDMANYVIPAFMCVMILLIFQIPAYVSTDNLPAVIALFLMYGWSITPVMYPASFWFNEPSTAYICLIVINLFTGITCIVSSFLLEIFSYDRDLERVHNVLKIVFMMFPNYCLGRGLIELAFNEYKNEFYFKTGQYDLMKSPMDWELIPRLLVAMASIGLAAFLVTLLCEYRFFLSHKTSSAPQGSLQEEDYDVATERKRVVKGNGKYDVLCLENLTKVYKTRKLGKHLAVDRLCLGVPPGECFGLLGVNGAGKTTTFKMLTGDITPTSGEAFLNGYSVLKDIKKVQQSIGYCPQFDSLYDELTAREHLQLYCRLRGVPPKDEKQVVEWALSKLGLSKYADKLSGTYSGGNKRKLSTAIALIGHPPLIFLDEPTTGMDPHSRRFLWNLILSLIQDGRSVVLTSHSMEECEVLCTRLAIMVNGRFQCLGTTQHLKNKFGEGYTFSVRIAGPEYERNMRDVLRFVQRNIPEATLKEQHYNMVQYEIKTRNVNLSQLFEQLEQAQRDLHVEDYSVSQNSLDNVFINFVKKQVEIVRDEAEDAPPRRRSWLSGRSRAHSALEQWSNGRHNRTDNNGDDDDDDDDDPLLRNLASPDVVDLIDDDDEALLQLDQADGTRLTLMPL